MELTYLGHSGMMIRGKEHLFILDYYLHTHEKGNTIENGVLDDATLSFPGKIYVLVSHSHGDHFNPVVLEFTQKCTDIVYIVSSDVAALIPQDFPGTIHVLEPDDRWEDENVTINAFGSTDLGVSFAVQVLEEGKHHSFFHAGDLNDWHWKEELSFEDAMRNTLAYLAELELIQSSLLSEMDLLMFPLDPRLGKNCGDGVLTFLDALEISVFAPMHFGDAYEVQETFLAEYPLLDTRMILWKRRGQTEIW